MAKIDSLEISIQSNIEKVNKNMDLLIQKMGTVARGISAIGSNKGIDEFIKSTKTASESMENVGKNVTQSTKPVEEQVKKIAKTFEQVKEPFKDLGKNFKISGDISDIEKAIQRYSNELEKAKLKEQTLSTKGMTDTKGYRDAVADVVKYQNVIESLKGQLEEIKKLKLPYPEPEISEFENDITQHLRSVGAFKELEEYLEEMRNSTQQATENVREFSGVWSGVKLPDFKDEEEKIQTTGEKIKALSEEFKDVGKGFYFEGNTEQLDAQINKLNAELEKLYEKRDKKIDFGQIDTNPFKDIIYEIQSVTNKLDILEQARPEALNQTLQENAEKARLAAEQLKVFEGNLSKLQVPPLDETNLKKLQSDLKKTEENLEKLRLKLANGLTMGKISANVDDSGYRNLREQIALTEKQAEALREKIGNTGVFERLRQSVSGASSGSKQLQKAFSSLYSMLKKVEKGIRSVLSKIGKLLKSMFSLGTATKKSSGGFNLGLKTILKYGFGIRSLYVLVNKLRSAIKEGMKNLIQYSDQTNQSVSTLSSSLSQFKNASAAAFAPILNAIAPALNQLIQLFIRATNAINQFFSALTGKGTWIRAKYVYEDVADKISGAADAAKGALQPFDKLNNLTTQKSAGAVSGINPGDMFETVPVEDKFKELSDKIKDIVRQLFAPLKEAWDREGKFVMDSWKYALDEVWKLIKDIGRDFLTVWQQPETVDMFADILHIVGDIGLIVGHLARNFREAWNENETGLHILENIRDIIAVIIHNIRLAADFTVEWADKLNFSPLLQAIERFTKSLIPVAEALSGVLMDFYTMVLLPLGKWTLEEGLPKLLDVFTEFNEKVDWQALRDNLAEFWKHLEPFAETIGEGLIIFIERVSDLVANFLNSETFVSFLHDLEDWMDSVTPEDVADGIEKLAKAFVALKVAILGFSALSAVTGILTTIKTFLSFFGIGGGASAAASGMKNAASSSGILVAAIGDLALALGTYFAVDYVTDNLDVLAESMGVNTDQARILSERYDGLTGKLTVLRDMFVSAKNGIEGYGFAADNIVGAGVAIEKAMEDISNGAILTEEHMSELQERFGLTDDDLEMLRQEMLDANPELRNLADNFSELENASVETLEEVYYGLQDVSNGIYDADDATSFLYGRFGDLTEGTRVFFDNLATGVTDIDDYTTAIENTSGTLKEFEDEMSKSGEYIAQGLTSGFENTEVGTAVGNFFSKFTDSVSETFGIHSPAERMKPYGEYITLGILEGFNSRIKDFISSVQSLFGKIKDSINGKLSEIKSVIFEKLITIKENWSNAWSSMKEKVSSVIQSTKSIISSAVSWISSQIKSILNLFGKVNSAAKSMTSGGIGGAIGGSFVKATPYSVKIPQYSSGGFPERYSLFTAGEEGVPEILGTVGGKNAVAGGDEITGIASAVYSTGKTEAQLLSEAIQLLQIIAEKDGYNSGKIFNDMREEASNYKKRTGNYAFT